MNDREYEIMFRREEGYWWYRGMRAVTRAFAPGIFNRGAGAPVLDAGCGTGRNLLDLANGGPPVGLDLSMRALGFARRRGPASLVCASVEALPFRSGSFRAALSRDVLCNVPDDARATREIARVLVPGGLFALSAPAFDALAGAHDVAVGALRRYTAGGLERLVKRAGLAVVRTTYANFFLAGPIWILRKVTGAKARGVPREDVRSDFGLAPKPFEEIFSFLLSIEARILAKARLPFGVTALILAQKPVQGAGTSEAGK